MLFSSLTFLYLFLPLTLTAYYLAPKKAKNAVLLLASLLFYFYGEPKYTLLLVFSSLSDWLHALYIENHRTEKGAKRALISSIVINLLMLGVFKYTDFLIGTVNTAFGMDIPLTKLPLPIGISFFTFQTMSYTIDVYRGKAHAQRNLLTLATYVCLFPQLVAGPIVRYVDVDAALADPRTSYAQFAYGVRRFALGLGKKILIANTLGELHAKLSGAAEASWLGSVFLMIAYTLQIYFDFSGYSDMAIGLGSMLGFSFPENFNYPFIAKSITDFWRRWHMTLSGWFRDYLYIPLGGNRVSKGRWAFNILVVWAATGLWHGASWNFVLWGAYFGVLLLLEKLFLDQWIARAPRWIGHAYTLLFVLFSFVIFSNDTLAGIGAQTAALFGGAKWVSTEAAYYVKSYAVVLLAAVVGSTPLLKRGAERLTVKLPKLAAVSEVVLCTALLLICTAMLVDSSFNPFLYFRF
ncbi:MAG: MBOAT family O-acyltransferase [Clostridia bacterium]